MKITYLENIVQQSEQAGHIKAETISSVVSDVCKELIGTVLFS